MNALPPPTIRPPLPPAGRRWPWWAWVALGGLVVGGGAVANLLDGKDNSNDGGSDYVDQARQVWNGMSGSDQFTLCAEVKAAGSAAAATVWISESSLTPAAHDDAAWFLSALACK